MATINPEELINISDDSGSIETIFSNAELKIKSRFKINRQVTHVRIAVIDELNLSRRDLVLSELDKFLDDIHAYYTLGAI